LFESGDFGEADEGADNGNCLTESNGNAEGDARVPASSKDDYFKQML